LLSFFFQAEDGIRDRNVTGVQTCALPISFWGQAKGPIEEGELKDIDTQINIGDNFTIDIPSAIISEIEQPLGGREHIEQTATLRGLLTRDGEGPISVEIINDKESY